MNNVEPGFWRRVLDLLLSPVGIAIIAFFISIYVIVTIINIVADCREEKERRRREALKAEKQGVKEENDQR